MDERTRGLVCAFLWLAGACGAAQLEPETADDQVMEVEEPLPAAEPEAPRVEVQGDRLIINQKILFEVADDELMGESNKVLDEIAKAMAEHSEIRKLHIIGHTDAKGSRGGNLRLSKNRASAVMAALQARNVKQQMESRGVGPDDPLCYDDTPECDDQNRRVEFLVER